MSKAGAKGGAGADTGIPVSNTPMPTLASDAFLVNDDGDDLADGIYRQPVRQPRGEAAARKAAFRRLAAQSAALAAGGGADDADDGNVPALAASASFNGPGGRDGFRSINPHQRTALEQSILDRIPARIQSNLVQDQVVGGRKYRGPGFLPDPAIVRFQDFVVGKPMTITVALTNVSNGFNVFKVGKLPSTIVDCIEVSHVPTGLLSAGLRSKLTVTFTPKENVDIDSEIPLLAQTGPIAIPLQCRRPRANVQVSTKVVDFSSVVVADKAVRKMTFRNTGATPTKVTLRGEQLLTALKTTQVPPPSSAGGGASEASPLPILTVTPSDKALTGLFIPAFGSATLSLTFAPYQPVDLDVSGFLTFDSDDVPDQPFFIRGHGVDVPVFIDRNETLDLGCCCDGTMYREKFSIRNTTTASAHVKPEVPALLRGLVEFVPPFGFAQPASSGAEQLEFQLRFVPDAAKLAANRERVAALEAAARERRLASGSDDDGGGEGQSTAAYIDELTAAANDFGTSDAATSVAGGGGGLRHSPDATSAPSSPEIRSRDVSPRPADARTENGDVDGGGRTTGIGTVGPSSTVATTGPSRAVRPTVCTDEELQIPVRVRVLSQAMPLYVTLCARLSPRRLGIEPNAIHFAGLSPAEMVKRTITLHNDTRLFRNVGLVKVPPNIRVEPRSANVKLAPGEKYQFDLCVHPPEAAAAGLAAADSFRQQVTVLTEHGESFPITVSGTVRSPPLRFSAGAVTLPACAVHDSVSTTLTLTNVSRSAQCFSFAKLMKRYGLRAMPHTGELQPGDSVSIVLSFDAHPAVAFPVTVPPDAADDADDADNAPPSNVESPAPGGKPGGKPAAPKKKSKAEEEAERKAKEEAEAAKAARKAALEAARQQALDELKRVTPWEESAAEETAAQAAAREHEIISALRRDADAQNAAATHVEPEPTEATVDKLDSSMPNPLQQQQQRQGASRREPWSRHRTVRVPCHIQGWAGHAIFVTVRVTLVEPLVIPAPTAALPSVVNTGGDDAAGVTSGSPVVDVALALGSELPATDGKTVTSRRHQNHQKLALTPADVGGKLNAVPLAGPGAPLPAGVSIDFGAVPSLAKATRTIHLHCVRQDGGDAPLRVAVAPFDPYGPFSIAKPPAVLSERGQRCEVTIAFRPRQKAVYTERLLLLVGDSHRIVVACRGEGLPTSLAVTVDQTAVGGASIAANGSTAKPTGAAAGKGASAAPGAKPGTAGKNATDLDDKSVNIAAPHVQGTERIAGDGIATIDADLGNCLVGEQTETAVAFQNNSPFPLTVEVTVVPDTVQPTNPNGQAPFAVNPTHFVLPANGRLDGTIAFRPQCAAAFTATAFVSFGGSESVKRLLMCGFGRGTGVYARFPGQSNAPLALLATTPPGAEVPLPSAGGGAGGADDAGIPLTRPNTTDAQTRPGTTATAAAANALAAQQATQTRELFQPRFQPFAIFGDAPPAIGTSSELPLEVYFAAEAGAAAAERSNATPTPGAAPPTASKGGAAAPAEAVAEAVTRTITFGTVAGSNAAEVTVEGLTEADTRAGWRVDVPKVTVAANGQKAALNVTFAPTVHVMNMVPLRGVAVACSASVRLVVKGGTPAADTTYHVRLVGTLKRP